MLTSVKRKRLHAVGFRFKFRKAYILRWVNLNCDRTSLFSKFMKGMYIYMGQDKPKLM